MGWLHGALAATGAGQLPFRLIRSEGSRAIVRVAHVDADAARRAWSADRRLAEGGRLQTKRTWGTLLGAKRWLASGWAAERRGPRRPASRR